MTDERLSPERAVRLLRAKAGELEADAKDSLRRDARNSIAYLTADIALVAGLLADHIEQTEARFLKLIEVDGVQTRILDKLAKLTGAESLDIDDANVMEMARESNRQIARAQEDRLLRQMRAEDERTLTLQEQDKIDRLLNGPQQMVIEDE